jgi:excisionase family DNA binding protein
MISVLEPKKRNRQPQPAAPNAMLVDMAELARLMSVSKRTIKRLHAGRKIPGVVELGRSVRFYLPKVKAWLERRAK